MWIAEDVIQQELRVVAHLRFAVETAPRVIEIDMAVAIEARELPRAELVHGSRLPVCGVALEKFAVPLIGVRYHCCAL